MKPEFQVLARPGFEVGCAGICRGMGMEIGRGRLCGWTGRVNGDVNEHASVDVVLLLRRRVVEAKPH